jgi:hypothetical protein
VSANPVIKNFAYCLAHLPDLVRYGSKPRREIAKSPSLDARLASALRSYETAVGYPPNQTFIGNLNPTQLASIPHPWFEVAETAEATGAFGEIVSQDLFYALLKRADVMEPGLIEINDACSNELQRLLASHPILGGEAKASWRGAPAAVIDQEIDAGSARALRSGDALRGCVRRDDRAEGREDENLDALLLLEALSSKASGALALKWLLHREGMSADQVDFIISCGEEAAGDRYQRGGGGMAKAIGEMCGCVNASGMDIKNFCAAPASALVTAGALVESRIHERVVVVGGGSIAKLGMKSLAFLDARMPILDDCIASMAFLVRPNDGASPFIHMEPGSIGQASIGASTSDEAVYRELILQPLAALGLSMSDIDKYAPELHDPEVMEHSGSGDVVRKNYRTIAAMAVLAGVITKEDMNAFVERIGMVGFAPAQGHIPSAVPFIGHAIEAMRKGEIRRAMFLCKASLFLNRLTELYDGVSFVLEAQSDT